MNEITIKRLEDMITSANTHAEYLKITKDFSKYDVWNFLGLSLQATMREFKLQMEALE